MFLAKIIYMGAIAYLDTSIFNCPQCNTVYAEASWYAVVLAADIECGNCHSTFNPSEYLTDRIMVEFHLDDMGKVKEIKKVG
jgi:transcription elongation factor Elf1